MGEEEKQESMCVSYFYVSKFYVCVCVCFGLERPGERKKKGKGNSESQARKKNYIREVFLGDTKCMVCKSLLGTDQVQKSHSTTAFKHCHAGIFQSFAIFLEKK